MLIIVLCQSEDYSRCSWGSGYINKKWGVERQVDDYYEKFYHKLEARYEQLVANNLQNIRDLLKWEEDVSASWSSLNCISLAQSKQLNNTFYVGENLTLKLTMQTGLLKAKDLKVELIFVERHEDGRTVLVDKQPFHAISEENGTTIFECQLNTDNVGLWDCAIRIIPQNGLLPHDQDFNLVKWM